MHGVGNEGSQLAQGLCFYHVTTYIDERLHAMAVDGGDVRGWAVEGPPAGPGLGWLEAALLTLQRASPARFRLLDRPVREHVVGGTRWSFVATTLSGGFS